MTSFWQAPAIVVVITWLSTPPGSLGHAAKQEALRRTLMPKSAMSLSLYDWPAAAAADVVPTPIAAASTPATPAPAAPSASAAPGAPVPSGQTLPASDEPKRDEAWWRARMAAARAALARDQTLADAMQSHINSLRADLASRDDPAQQAALRQRLTTALAELDRLTQQVAADRESILAVEDDARRQNIPSAWIRNDGAISSGRSP